MRATMKCGRGIALLFAQLCFFGLSAQAQNIELSAVIIPGASQEFGSASADSLDSSALNASSSDASSGTVYLSRYNLRTYENERYIGLRYVELSGQIDRVGAASDSHGRSAQASAATGENSRNSASAPLAEYHSSFWNTSASIRDLRTVSAPIDEFQNYDFSEEELLYSAPAFRSYPEHLYFFPEYRNFPLLPRSTLQSLYGAGIPPEGYTYEANAYRLIDPEGTGNFTPFRILVRYIYRGVGDHLGSDAHFFDADFAIRSDGRINGISAQGSNRVSIAVTPGPSPRVFMRNIISEAYSLGGKTIRLEGFGLTWIRNPDPVYTDPNFLDSIASYAEPENNDRSVDRDSTRTAQSPSPADSDVDGDAVGDRPSDVDAEATPSRTPDPRTVAEAARVPDSSAPAEARPTSGPEISLNPDLATANLLDPILPNKIELDSGEIDIIRDTLGVKLSIPNIRFQPDSSELVPGEAERIGVVASILKSAGDRNVLVLGHSASVGRPAGELELSIQRAESVVNFLGEEGIAPGRMRYEGRGSSEPLADTDSEAGRALNRRVEVIILN